MPTSPLYAIADTATLGERLLPSVQAALEGDCQWVQYRDKSADIPRRRAEAQQLLTQCRRFGAKLLINDDPQLALAVGADGVHLGQTDGDPESARALLGPQALIGVTCHDSLALAEQARASGANYVAFGRFFPSQTKPEAPPAPLDFLSRARAQLGATTIVAIGGIDLENAHLVLRAGADRLAISQGLFRTNSLSEITARARAFAQPPI